jgi:hypothetical protein
MLPFAVVVDGVTLSCTIFMLTIGISAARLNIVPAGIQNAKLQAARKAWSNLRGRRRQNSGFCEAYNQTDAAKIVLRKFDPFFRAGADGAVALKHEALAAADIDLQSFIGGHDIA